MAPSGLKRATEVFGAVSDMYSKNRSVIDTDPLYVAQDLVLFGYFEETDPPTLTDVGQHAQDLIREVVRE